ncbi:putative secreted protein [Sinobacterium caligoides]|uniref:Putative secreted protein n=1 Tax=Sinobacterium caligoides TaxID=933926 RepID=A0A3N2DZN7_9GAMM|nr:VPLPA-CTERM sorting domain-containing protein [Sinobacterium caligoides]ROS05310.1 putative secreted protein [Sinobacterium caligoides]
MKMLTTVASAAFSLTMFAATPAFADFIDLTGHGSLNNSTSNHTLFSNDGTAINISAGSSNIGTSNLEGFGVKTSGGNLSGIQNNETLSFSFGNNVNVTGISFRQWEGPDKATLNSTFGSLTLNDDSCMFCSGQDFDLSLDGISSFNITGASSLSVFYVSGISFENAELPLPASAWLFGSALLGLAAARKKKS